MHDLRIKTVGHNARLKLFWKAWFRAAINIIFDSSKAAYQLILPAFRTTMVSWPHSLPQTEVDKTATNYSITMEIMSSSATGQRASYIANVRTKNYVWSTSEFRMWTVAAARNQTFWVRPTAICRWHHHATLDDDFRHWPRDMTSPSWRLPSGDAFTVRSLIIACHGLILAFKRSSKICLIGLE